MSRKLIGALLVVLLLALGVIVADALFNPPVYWVAIDTDSGGLTGWTTQFSYFTAPQDDGAVAWVSALGSTGDAHTVRIGLDRNNTTQYRVIGRGQFDNGLRVLRLAP
jgi:hypothetical protein